MPTGRIQRLLARALAADVRPKPVAVKYDPADLALPEPVRIGKRLKEYISAQPVTLRADEELVVWLSFDGSVESDLFPRVGHKAFGAACGRYYCKPQDALATFEWQHSSIDYPKLVNGGLVQIRAEIAASKRKWSGDKDRLDYLEGMELALDGLETRAKNCVAEGTAKPPARARADRDVVLRDEAGVRAGEGAGEDVQAAGEYLLAVRPRVRLRDAVPPQDEGLQEDPEVPRGQSRDRVLEDARASGATPHGGAWRSCRT